MVLLSRLRRHRLPIFITIVFVVLIYHFTSLRDSAGARHAVDRLKEHNLPHIHQTEPAAGAPPLIDGKKANQLPLPVVKPEQKPESKPPSRIEPPKKPDAPTSDNAAADNTSLKKQEGSDSSKQQAETSSTKDSENVAQIDDDPHWSRTPEHYPIPTRSIISLPTNSPVDVPYIQAVFPAESESEKNARMSRLNSIKDTFIASWNAYKKHAWGHDELMPVSGDYIDTFGGWGASLVDALDTLWIMNLKDEFEEAVEAVGKINFHSSKLMRIPLFETTIRHLGGLIAAYDISEGKYNVLLEKAIELADLLYGAFDTPNRMPLLYYAWRSKQVAMAPHAPTHAASSELASLSLEFTRLAQITENNTYYDAVARITNALEESQFNSSLPGLWPDHLDTSICKKDLAKAIEKAKAWEKKNKNSKNSGTTSTTTGSYPYPKGGIFAKPEANQPVKLGSVPEHSTEAAFKVSGSYHPIHDASNPQPVSASQNTGQHAHGIGKRSLNTMPTTEACPEGVAFPMPGDQVFSLGARLDSLYEYLLKEYILLGGTSDQLKRLYSTSMDVANKTVLFRPMVPNNPNILFAGEVHINRKRVKKFKPIGSHLGCFAGGMFAMGSRVLDRTHDLEIGSKLTDGCVWAYGATKSGIMPEVFQTMACKNRNNCTYAPSEDPDSEAELYTNSQGDLSGFELVQDKQYRMRPEAIESVFYMYRISGNRQWMEKGWNMWQAVRNGTDSTKVAENTWAGIGHAAISDVTLSRNDEEFDWNDSMESFWFSETLKYFYLLFSTPDTVSLDDYVLNTEAHPFKRLDFGRKRLA